MWKSGVHWSDPPVLITKSLDPSGPKGWVTSPGDPSRPANVTVEGVDN